MSGFSLPEQVAAVDVIETLTQRMPVLGENFSLFDSPVAELVIRLSAKGCLSVADEDEFAHGVRSTSLERGKTLEMILRVAEHQIERCDALEQMPYVEFVSHADTTVNLHRLLANETNRFADSRLS